MTTPADWRDLFQLIDELTDERLGAYTRHPRGYAMLETLEGLSADDLVKVCATVDKIPERSDDPRQALTRAVQRYEVEVWPRRHALELELGTEEQAAHMFLIGAAGGYAFTAYATRMLYHLAAGEFAAVYAFLAGDEGALHR